ncbi:MAG: hypothetical protein HOP33_11530 [Verrucomicrobia bacterium]|nr:hypothetical protein [Verrucomicrobiota bacterium]
MQNKSLQTFLYSAGGVAAMAAILVAVNILVGAARTRVDLTKEQAYTLSDGTKAILNKLDTPVTIRFFFSKSAESSPQAVFFKGYAAKVEDLLAEYKLASKGKIILEKIDPKPDSDDEDKARLNGVEGMPFPNGEKFYLGLSVSVVGTETSIPFLTPDRERQLEYDLSRAITKIVTPEKPVVGVMSALPVFGMPSNPMMAQMGQRGQEPWAIINELKNDFNVKRVEMTAEKIDDDVKVLVVIHPKEISDAAQFAIDQFLMRGGKMIAFLDANSLVDQPRGQNQMMAQMGGGGSSLDKLLKTWGIQFENSKVVADMNYQLEVGGGNSPASQRPTWLSITPGGINTNDIVTGQIDNVWYFAGGVFSGTPADGLKQTVLLKSTTDSALVEGFLSNLSPESAMKDFKPSGKEQTLALRLTGKFKSAFPAGKPVAEKPADGSTNTPAATPDSLKESKMETSVIIVGDSDMVNDNFTVQDMQTPFGNMRRQLNSNLNLVQNAVEQLSGDNNLIAVRSRALMNRPFEIVKQKEAEASKQFQGEIDNLQKKSQEAQQRINEMQAQKSDKSQRFIISPEQQAEIAKLEKESLETGKTLRELQKKLRREVDSLKTRLTWWNILAMPALVSITGIVLAIYKRKLTAAK